jgi:myo-inositol-1(or 4)-monophosphatase
MIKQVSEIIEVADQIAMNLYRRERGQLKADGTWITRADLHIESFLRNELHSVLDTRIFGEEGQWTGDATAPYVVIIDPIEGTGPFRDQVPIWGISVAIFHEGRPWFGSFRMPAANHFFMADADNGARWNGEPLITPSTPITKSSYLGVSSDAHRWHLKQYPGKIRAFGVSGYHLLLVASGALQATLLTRFQFYDIAAGAIVLWAAGGELYYLSGAPISPSDIINLQPPTEAVLACHPEHFEETAAYILK